MSKQKKEELPQEKPAFSLKDAVRQDFYAASSMFNVIMANRELREQVVEDITKRLLAHDEKVKAAIKEVNQTK